jgi:tRNA-dihydrouridine synthase B
MSNEVVVGPVAVAGRVWLAPMTGVTDLPFRRAAVRLGAPYVATEMVACESLIAARPEMVRRAAVGDGLPLVVIQLVGGDAGAIRGAAAMAAAAGAAIVDLNFGCPAKSVTGIACGSALMRDLDAAEGLIAAAVEGSRLPVTVKMRLGWDDRAKNAPELAARAQAAGAAAITVHGRTRQQFYGGVADWSAVRTIKAAVDLPVIVNGDVVDLTSARAALERSGADAVMIGRGALGRPWIAAAIEAGLSGRPSREPDSEERTDIVLEHLADSIRFYGETRGARMFRKHLSAYIDHAPWPRSLEARRAARASLCRLETPREIASALTSLWGASMDRLAA